MKLFKNKLFVFLVITLFVFGSVAWATSIHHRLRAHLAQLSTSVRSNGSWWPNSCDTIGDMTDNDQGNAASTGVTFDSKDTYKFDTNTTTDPNKAVRTRDHGSLDGVGNTIYVSFNIYHDQIGTVAGGANWAYLRASRSDWRLDLRFGTDGLFLYDGAAVNEIGTDLVVQDAWQEWTIIVDLSGGVASADCDIYLDEVLKATDADCSNTGTFTDGEIEISVIGENGANDDITYLDWLYIGNGAG